MSGVARHSGEGRGEGQEKWGDLRGEGGGLRLRETWKGVAAKGRPNADADAGGRGGLNEKCLPRKS